MDDDGNMTSSDIDESAYGPFRGARGSHRAMTDDQRSRIARTAWQAARAAGVAIALVVVGAVVSASNDVRLVDWATVLSLSGGSALVAVLTAVFALKDNRPSGQD